MDRRLTPATDRVALDSLRGVLDRPSYVPGQPARVVIPVVDLLGTPEGRRDRQLNFGADVTVIDRDAGMSFVRAAQDGYCGWIADTALTTSLPPITHRVTAPATHVYLEPDMKRPEQFALSLGARVSVTQIQGRFATLATGGHVPVQHLGDSPASDPVPVAESLLGTPYLWGGNSRAGIDCSGLVQAALTACDIACPGDSDLQRAAFAPTDTIARGDLLFWPGHVAMAVSADLMIHATAWTMCVTFEPIRDAIARIDAAGEGPFLGAHRPGDVTG